MTAAGNKVQDHYASEGIAARILAALGAAGGSEAGPITPDALAPLDHFHGRGLTATKEMVALLEPLSGERILDIGGGIDRKSTRLNSSHANISYSVFCFKKKKKQDLI